MPATGQASDTTADPTTGRLSGYDLFAGSLAALLPIAFSTAFTSPYWTPKAALLLLTVPLGAIAVLRRPTLGDRRAVLTGLALVATAAISTALANEPDLAFFGAYSHGVGLLFVAALVSCWLIGGRVTERGQSMVEKALFAATLANVAFALVQPLADLSPYGLGLLQSRTPGLMGNPVHLAALLTGGYGMVAWRMQKRAWPGGIGVAAIAAAVQLSGSRFAFLAVLMLTLGLLASKRTGRMLMLTLLTVSGLALGQLINSVGHGVSGTTRIDEGLGGNSTAARIDTWQEAADAISEKPIFGHGPGRYLTATAPHRSLDLARRGPERYFRDAHNIVVEWATTMGITGAAVLSVFLALALRRARGPLLWFGLGVLALHMVQPLYVGTTPLAFLALGAAGPRIRYLPVPMPVRAVGSALVTASILAAASLVRGDAGLQQADLAYSPERAGASLQYLPAWPEPRSFVGLMEVSLSITERNPSRYHDALGWYESAAAADPEDPRRWNQLGGAYLGGDRARDALAAYRRAIEVNPLSYGGLTGIARSSLALDDPASASEAVDRAEEIVGRDHPTIVDLRRRIRSAKRAGP